MSDKELEAVWNALREYADKVKPPGGNGAIIRSEQKKVDVENTTFSRTPSNRRADRRNRVLL